MIIIGLTGSIATGKSFVARCFAKLGAAVFDADVTVHQMLTYSGDAVPLVRKEFPESYVEGSIDRKILGNIVFKDEEKRKKLESIIHPIVSKKRKEFLAECRKQKIKVVVLEIPLLFETESESQCDVVVVTMVDAYTQRQRAMKREGMTLEKFEAVNKLQMDSDKKAKKANFVIDTGVSEFSVFREAKKIMNNLIGNNAGNHI